MLRVLGWSDFLVLAEKRTRLLALSLYLNTTVILYGKFTYGQESFFGEAVNITLFLEF